MHCKQRAQIQPELLVQSIIKRANEVLQPYKDPAVGAPDPSFVLHLNDEAFTGSNLYAVQKLFDGPFQFDVFYESASAKQKLSCPSPSFTSIRRSAD